MSAIMLHNTLTRSVDSFAPIDANEVKLYTCGPTVYDYATIGNMRAYLFADILRRSLEYFGYHVKQVMNITDVGHLVSDADEGEDKMLIGMRREGKTPWEIAEHYTAIFFRHAAALNILRPHVVAKATEHVPQMIEFIKRLEALGYTYEISDGVYFDISKFEAYGQLSKLDLEGQRAGARVDVNLEKRHPADFAVWRKADPSHIMQWDSPWGRGYPGWHIECSAMSMEYLGERIDIHTGGIDHVPVHHEGEIAQNDAALGHRVVQRWMHNEFLQIDGGRMGKSLGNFYTVDDLVDRGFEPLAYRYFSLNAHYRSKLNFTWDALKGAQTALHRLWQRAHELATRIDSPAVDQILAGGRSVAGDPAAERFAAAIADDLGTPQAMAVLWEVARRDDDPEQCLALLIDFDRVLALDLARAARGELQRNQQLTDDDIPAEASSLLDQRERARSARDWAAADAIRNQLASMGYTIEDTPTGPKLKQK